MSSILITGGSRGIGFELARQFSELPETTFSKILVTTRSNPPQQLVELIAAQKGRIVEVRAEITTEQGTKELAAKVDEILGDKGLDILVNNAGIMPVSPTESILGLPAEQLSDALSVNVVGVHLVTSALLPALRRGKEKKLTVISTTVGSMALAHKFVGAPTPAYKISKAAVNMLVLQYGLALESEGFKVAAISPGWLKTDMGSQYADLEVEVGVAQVKKIILELDASTNGKLLTIHVPGWENAPGVNQYPGGVAPW